MKSIIFALHLLMLVQGYQHPPRCVGGEATLHNAWASVFANFPARIDPEADGYIAVRDCGEMGQRKRLFFGGRWWDVRVADCLATNDAAPASWAVDVDYRLWWQAYPHRAITQRPAIICDAQ